MRNIVITMAAALLLSPATALAQQQQQQQQPAAAAKTENPNEIVCEKQEVVGSRIATQRICMTRSQWAEQRRSDRMDVEKVQTQRGCTKNGC
jgi:invasion protein IalB